MSALGVWWALAFVICALADRGIGNQANVLVVFTVSLILGEDVFVRPD